ncbi:lipopolysaccharide assembly protein LapB [Natronospira bacteriovora]|uniref:Lipopolysaccharide assembly protein B n=1 Tax=Natronospira bacteriovora TaxID=3069753 RepID=A0ABU0W589_9GAMM|nr:lipopolysaccharide assembly protein LapB [Natronospira sp. AB-CW4]MDQ2069187.1 lipopolysaccharide assembly protein LapB [Natronospira sp. AB-CW4]
MDAELFLIILLASLATLLLGWLFGRRHRGGGNAGAGGTAMRADYYRGLNHLLEEEPDKAIEVFIRMVEVDSDTVETHFALGSLFRRRGEVDRAIRIHQNLIARPNLSRHQRHQALFALAEDYMRAGLLDRAESLFLELTDVRAYMQAALGRLVTIYEQQKDWEQAILMARKLELASGQPQYERAAQYYCELAEHHLAGRDLRQARRFLKRAEMFDRRNVRAALLRARLMREEGNPKAAIRGLRKALESDVSLALELLPTLHRLFQEIGHPQGFSAVLQELQRSSGNAVSQIALAAIVDPTIKDPEAEACIAQYLRSAPGLKGFTDLVELLTGEPPESSEAGMRPLRHALQRFLEAAPRYRCSECGFTARHLHWQCPSCKNWNTTRPHYEIALPTVPQNPTSGIGIDR